MCTTGAKSLKHGMRKHLLRKSKNSGKQIFFFISKERKKNNLLSFTPMKQMIPNLFKIYCSDYILNYKNRNLYITYFLQKLAKLNPFWISHLNLCSILGSFGFLIVVCCFALILASFVNPFCCFVVYYF